MSSYAKILWEEDGSISPQTYQGLGLSEPQTRTIDRLFDDLRDNVDVLEIEHGYKEVRVATWTGSYKTPRWLISNHNKVQDLGGVSHYYPNERARMNVGSR